MTPKQNQENERGPGMTLSWCESMGFHAGSLDPTRLLPPALSIAYGL